MITVDNSDKHWNRTDAKWRR